MWDFRANYTRRQFVFSLALEITIMGGHEDERQKPTREKVGNRGIIGSIVQRKQRCQNKCLENEIVFLHFVLV